MAAMHTSHATSPLRALYRVFVQPQLSQSTRTAPQWPQSQARVLQRSQQPRLRSFATTRRHNAKTRAPETRTQKWDNEITARTIYLVDPKTGKLEVDPEIGDLDRETGEIDPETVEPKLFTRYDVMKNLDTKLYRLVQLSPDDDPNHRDRPICKIVSKKSAYEAEQRKKAQQKEAKAIKSKEQSLKTLELNWAIDPNDLGHRLDKVKEFLAEGRKVEIVLASKKRGRKASPQECKDVLDRIKSAVGDVKGAVEAKPFEGKMAGFGTVVLQGKAGAAAKEASTAE